MPDDAPDKPNEPQREDRSTNYQVFFILGISLTVLGIATANVAFLGAGIAFFVIAVGNMNRGKRKDRGGSRPREGEAHLEPDADPDQD
jgi:hypothetical protein